MQQLTLNQTIEKIQHFINTGQGDTGRLSYIIESLKRKKRLYDSDRLYLEKKLDALFSLDNRPQKKPDSDLLAKINSLINSGIGDPGRLQFIHDTISQNKVLYHSDHAYLESKLSEQSAGIHTTPRETFHDYPAQLDERLEEKITQIRKLEDEIKTNEHLQLESTRPKEILRLRGAMPKDWNPSKLSEELTGIYETIKSEQVKLDEQKLVADEIHLQRSKLSQLILNRQEYERQISLEKIKLDSQIKEEKERIETQTKMAEQIALQKEELGNVTREKNIILQEIQKIKESTVKELEQQRMALSQVQLEQTKIEDQVKKEQDLLSKITEEQKAKLNKQLEIARQIKEKQTDLDYTRHEYEKIAEQIRQEKLELRESKKLQKSIFVQEKTLLKTKNERLQLIALIEQQKELLSKQTKEEEEKLKEQSDLVKQLSEEKLDYERLKQKRIMLEKQIKEINKKLKEK